MKKTGNFAIKHLISQRNRNFAKNNPMEVIRYINCCIVEFGQRLGLEPKWACRYLYLHGGLELLDKNYQAEHLLPLDDTIDDLISYCKRHGGTLE